jgi:hypothetical protein
MSTIDPLYIAAQALEYVLATGRFGGEAETFIKEMGEDEFLILAADKWVAAGSPKFINGMKDVMRDIIWPKEQKHNDDDQTAVPGHAE